MDKQFMAEFGITIGIRNAKCAEVSKERKGKYCVFKYSGTMYLVTGSLRQAKLSSSDHTMMSIWHNGSLVA